MGTTHEPAAGMAPHEAIATVQELGSLHAALARRTSGVTWMLWGIAITGLFVTYNFVGVVVDNYATDAARLFPFLWVPWITMAVIASMVLWRSAGLVMRVDLSNEMRDGLLIMGGFIVAFTLAFWLVNATGVPIIEPAVSLSVVGFMTLIMGAAGLNAYERPERRAAILAGFGLVVVALVASVLLAGTGDAAYAWFSLIAPTAVAVSYFLVGGYVASRG